MNMATGNVASAVPLLTKAANEGDKFSQKTLGILYSRGFKGVLPKDDAKALYWYKAAAAKMDGDALGQLGMAYLHGRLGLKKDPKLALEYFDKSIAQGNSTGKFGRAVLLTKGWGVEQNLEEAFKLTREAAFQKVPGAAYNLAEMYRNGVGVEKNLKEANVWYAKAAPEIIQNAMTDSNFSQIHAAAGMLYYNGWGVSKDQKAAARFFAHAVPMLKKEAASGDSSAQMFLAEMMASGYGMPKDVAGGQALMQKVADKGDLEAKWYLENTTVFQANKDASKEAHKEASSKEANK